MAEQKEQTETTAQQGSGGKGRLKLLLIVGGVMAVEAGGILAITAFSGASRSNAGEVNPDLLRDPSEQTQEVLIVDDRFQNMKEGRVWIWEIAVYVKVQARQADRVHQVLEQRGAEIKQGISQIVARAQHAHLKEADRQTLNRQMLVYLEDIFGTDSAGQPRVESVLIPKCRGLPSDF